MLEQSFTRGVAWMSASAIGARAVTLIGGVILARLLLPEHFGLFNAAMVIIGAVQLLPDMGLGQALIAHRGDSQRAASSTFYAVIVTSVGVALAVWMLARHLALIMQQPALAPVLRVLALNIVVMAAAAVPIALMQKAQRWRDQALVELFAPLVSTGVMVTLALLGFGAWSIVYGYVARAITLALSVWCLSGWRPGWGIDWRAFVDMFRFGKWIVLDRLSAFALLNMDNAYLARWQGARVLGYYALPYNWITLPIQQVVIQSNKVLYPVLASLNDVSASRTMLLKACRMLSFLISPIYLFWLWNASTFVEGLFGKKWLPCVPVLQWLSVYGIAYALAGGIIGSFYWAMKRPELAVYPFWAALAVALAGLIYGGGSWGAVQVAQVFTLAMYVRASLMVFGLVRFYGFRLREVVRSVTDGWLSAFFSSFITAMLCRATPLPAMGELVIALVVHGNLYLLTYGWLKHRQPFRYYHVVRWKEVMSGAGATPSAS
jgi:O-antigen/teichoic acid export membrane protein